MTTKEAALEGVESQPNGPQLQQVSVPRLIFGSTRLLSVPCNGAAPHEGGRRCKSLVRGELALETPDS